MKKNVGAVDGFIRFLVGISFLLNIIILEPSVLGSVVLAAIGASMIFSTFTGFCFLYAPFKINTACSEGDECSAEEVTE